MQLEHTFQNVRSQNARFQYVRKLRQNVRADATKIMMDSVSKVISALIADIISKYNSRL